MQRILDTADIVEVVSDFVNLKKRGANYIGLCPFHNERTPSFSVSKSKGICKCFSCGKGGSPVNFIMEHEQLSYWDALRYLARKYHIEIKEHEMTDQEREEASVRESMLAVNDFALKHFQHNLTDTDDGRDIGLSYYRERGINDQMIERFKLGYALEQSDTLYNAAQKAGYAEKYLIETGLCAKNDRGRIYDRFRGRVIYPVFSVSGRVVAFGGRTLRKDKNVAKYVNSPESPIYHKSNELYGLYQAKKTIVQRDKCILVEGYMDVISMHQVGVENVVASSGTSLTDGQIRMIHRFTDNVTVIYDSDAAGIKASLRGIDMLLAEGMNIKVLLLPDGDDPDSFAQSHSSSEVEEYIAKNETDFIRFKTNILLKDTESDPVSRARVVNDIIKSISVIPDNVVRAEYIKLCARMMEIDEKVLMLQLQKFMAEAAAKRGTRPTYQQEQPQTEPQTEVPLTIQQPAPPVAPPTQQLALDPAIVTYERELIKYIVKYGLAYLPVAEGEEPITVLDYVWAELDADGIAFTSPLFLTIFNRAIEIMQTQWTASLQQHKEELTWQMQRRMSAGIDEIRQSASDLAEIEAREAQLKETCDNEYIASLNKFCASYLENIFLNDPDDNVRRTATDLATEKYVLSKMHTHYAHIPTESERLIELVPRAVAELKLSIINRKIDDNYKLIKQMAASPDITQLLTQQKNLFAYRITLAKYLGERIVTPPMKN